MSEIKYMNWLFFFKCEVYHLGWFQNTGYRIQEHFLSRFYFLAHLSHGDKVSFCDLSFFPSSLVR